MASALYDKGREGFLDGSIDWDTDDIRVMLVKTGYTVNLSTHTFLSDVTPASFDNGRTAALASKTVAAGVADSADPSLTATAATSSIALVVYKNTGTDATSRLIAYIDTATGLPFTPAAGQTISIVWDNTANKIFKL